MSGWLIIVTGLIYAYIAIEQGLKGNIPMLICYICYAGANVGLWMMATKWGNYEEDIKEGESSFLRSDFNKAFDIIYKIWIIKFF